VRGQIHAPAALVPGKDLLCGPQSWSGRGGEEKNSQHLSVLESPIIQRVAERYTIELCYLPPPPKLRMCIIQLI